MVYACDPPESTTWHLWWAEVENPGLDLLEIASVHEFIAAMRYRADHVLHQSQYEEMVTEKLYDEMKPCNATCYSFIRKTKLG